ncbi:hypothetical protein J6590_078191 [Homalodisca vitripennis]|nr:hypothetical protein J6590_078191 [Homalodisca vitripennis]
MMERLGIGVVIGELAGATKSKTTTTRESRKSKTGFEKRSSGVPVLVFVCGKNLLGKMLKAQPGLKRVTLDKDATGRLSHLIGSF